MTNLHIQQKNLPAPYDTQFSNIYLMSQIFDLGLRWWVGCATALASDMLYLYYFIGILLWITLYLSYSSTLSGMMIYISNSNQNIEHVFLNINEWKSYMFTKL